MEQQFIPMEYLSSDGRMRFDFLFCYYPDLSTWRIYIINRIRYGLRLRRDFHATHRLHDAGEDYDYICWGGIISTFEQAEAVASLWADSTSIMLNTGRPFDEVCRELQDKEGY